MDPPGACADGFGYSGDAYYVVAGLGHDWWEESPQEDRKGERIPKTLEELVSHFDEPHREALKNRILEGGHDLLLCHVCFGCGTNQRLFKSFKKDSKVTDESQRLLKRKSLKEVRSQEPLKRVAKIHPGGHLFVIERKSSLNWEKWPVKCYNFDTDDYF